jgi:hypothetical protein
MPTLASANAVWLKVTAPHLYFYTVIRAHVIALYLYLAAFPKPSIDLFASVNAFLKHAQLAALSIVVNASVFVSHLKITAIV